MLARRSWPDSCTGSLLGHAQNGAHFGVGRSGRDWLRRAARRKATTLQRARLVKAVERASAAETKAVQLTRAALLRAAGLGERPAAAAAIYLAARAQSEQGHP